MRRPSHVVGAVALGAALCLTSACSGSGSSPSSATTPTATGPTVRVPSGVTTTAPGTTLSLGRSAVVPYVANPRKKSVIAVAVTKVVKGSIRRDFRNFVLSAHQRRSVPYYVSVRVRNDGPGQLGGLGVPVFSFDTTHTATSATELRGSFKPCKGGNLPAKFGPRSRTRLCLVYLLPHGARLTGVQLRTSNTTPPVQWSLKH
ncbi:MAG: hypothetical protein ACRDP1_16885 [Nocardioidaceae bacterium]